MEFTFFTVSKVIFGPGRMGEIGVEATARGSRVLLVTGRHFLRQTGRLAAIEKCLRARSLEVFLFERVPPEPTLAAVEEGITECRTQGCDIVVAVGGGSALDVGKTIAALAPAGGTVHEYFHGRAVERKGWPFIAVPTTAGSGAEVTPNAVLTDKEEGVKASIRSPYMLADVAIVDPELTLSLPPDVTAHSGMDALCQAVEALVSLGATPLTDALAMSAAVRLIKCLPLVYRSGSELDLRTEVALGSLMGGMAFANARLGLAHGMAHPLGVVTGMPHGLICALLLPEVVRFNASVSAAKYAGLARAVEVAEIRVSDEGATSALVDAFERLNMELGIEKQRTSLRVDRALWPTIIAQTLASGSAKSNPRAVTAADVEQVLRSF